MSGRSSREGNGSPLQYSCLENPRTGEPGELQSMGCKEVDMTEQLTTTKPPQKSDHHTTLDAVCTVSTVMAAIYHPIIIFISSFNPQGTPWVGYDGQPHFIDKETEAASLTCLLYCSQVVGKTHHLSEFVIPLREITKNLWVILDNLLLPLRPFNQQYLPTSTPDKTKQLLQPLLTAPCCSLDCFSAGLLW